MSQKELKKYVAKKLNETHDGVTVGDGYVYAPGSFPVLLVAHMDTVHKELPKQIYYDKDTDAVFSPQGIGGDDRCGVYMTFEVLKKFNCSVLFTEDEEIGGVGAEKFLNTKLARTLDFNYIIEFDRQGKNDAVFYECDNPEFEEFITKEFYKTAYGTFSDISYLAPYLGCAAVNLSCGYYKAHTTNEYVVLKEMEDSIQAACAILERTTESDNFTYVEADYYSQYDYGYDDKMQYYAIEYQDENHDTQWFEVEARSTEEAIGKWVIENPKMCFENLIDVENYSDYF
jgi:acetylornithine deacetylase/succinyl-diaminopimelate desuccinylase-like protein